MEVFRKTDFKFLAGGLVVFVILGAVIGDGPGQGIGTSLLLLAVFIVIWMGRFFNALSPGPFLTKLGWISLGLFSLQAVVFSMILANAMQSAARNVEYQKAQCAREGNQNCYVSYYHGDVEALRMILWGGSLLCLAGIAWSRKLAIGSMSKKS